MNAERASTEDYDAYYRALGLFIHTFSTVEGALQMLATTTAGLSFEAGSVVFGAMTINPATEAVRNLRKAKKLPQHAPLERALIQLGKIAVLRNKIVHRGVHLRAGGEAVTRAGMTSPASKPTFAVSVSSLGDMSSDLRTIEAAIALGLTENYVVPDDTIASFQQSALLPWRYKS